MPFILIDHNFRRHPKFANMPDVERMMWVDGIAYAAEFWTDGFIPSSEFSRKSQRTLALDLIKRGLWHPISVNGVEGFQIHDYLKYQTSKESYEKKREYDRSRKRKAIEVPQGITKETDQVYIGNQDGIQGRTELNLKNSTKTTSPRAPWVDQRSTVTPPAMTDKDRISDKSPMPERAREIFEKSRGVSGE